MFPSFQKARAESFLCVPFSCTFGLSFEVSTSSAVVFRPPFVCMVTRQVPGLLAEEERQRPGRTSGKPLGSIKAGEETFYLPPSRHVLLR